MSMSDFLWRRFVVVWAFAVAMLYWLVLAEWVRPSVIKWALPVDWAGGSPDLALFLLRIILLAAGAFVFLAAGCGAGKAVAGFISMPARCVSRACLLGWFAAGTFLFGLGLNGLFFTGVFTFVLAFLVISGAAVLFRHAASGRLAVSRAWKRPDVFFPLGVVAWMILLTCLAPETFQDALRYHLFMPKRFILEHKFIFYSDFFFWSYMGPFHALLASALGTGGVIWAKSLNLLCGLLCLATLLRIAALAGIEESDRFMLLTLAATAPGFVLVTGSIFMENELGLALLIAVEFMLMGGYSLRARMRWMALFLSIAASVKYTAYFGALGVAAALGLSGKGEWRSWFAAGARAWIVPACFLAIPLIPWMAGRLYFTGDPVSPVLARLGMRTMDSGSDAALAKAYEFAGEALRRIAENPELLLAYPFNFAGAHGGFWEHPGPAIPMLLPAAVFAFTRLSPGVVLLLFFALGSAGGWLLFFGGVSPHYVAGVTGVWTAAFVGVLRFLPEPNRVLFRNLLRFSVMYQALICVVMVMVGWGPKSVAMGFMSQSKYLDGGLEPKGIHYVIRKELERKYPARGTVYVYGDDTSYYLEGRVQLDYEAGFDPLLWRMAAQSGTPAELRKRMKQRGWTHVLYSTRWPEEFVFTGEIEFGQSARTLDLVERFWAAYAVPAIEMELSSAVKPKASYVFGIARAPRPGYAADSFSARLPFIPGAEGLVGEGDRYLKQGKIGKARATYSRMLEEYPGSVLLCHRMAVADLELNAPERAAAWLRKAQAKGWEFRKLAQQIRARWSARSGQGPG